MKRTILLGLVLLAAGWCMNCGSAGPGQPSAVLSEIVTLAPAPPLPPLSGAIFSSTSNGEVVNGNSFADCCEVYLNGGPPPNAPCKSAGLPDGDYYFQVTNPSGSVLLSTDSIDQRKIKVSGGVITQYYGTSGDCVHQAGAGTCPGAISVQLMPFSATPNNGGVYKVWITPVEDYNANGGFGGRTKTDNFKCGPACENSPICSLNDPTIIGALTGTASGGEGTLTCQASSSCQGWAFTSCDIAQDGTLSISYSVESGAPAQCTVTVVVTDSRGCQSVCTKDVDLCALGQLSCSIDSPTAAGSLTGSITGGLPDYTCAAEFTSGNGWVVDSCAVSGSTFTVTYHVEDPATADLQATCEITITDEVGCQTTCNVPVSGLSGCTIDPTAAALCGATGTADLEASPVGGLPDFTYAWTGPGGFTADTKKITVSTPGIYTVTITDGNGFTSTCCAPVVSVDITGLDKVCAGKTGICYTAAASAPDVTVTLDGCDWQVSADAALCDPASCTAPTGACSTCVNAGIEDFTVTVTMQGVLQYDCAGVTTSTSFKLTCSKDVDVEQPKLSGTKYVDRNLNGVKDDGEGGLAGFHIVVIATLPDSTVQQNTYTTDADGKWSSDPLPPGTQYVVCEAPPPPGPGGTYWLQTGPKDGAASEGATASGGCWSGTIPTDIAETGDCGVEGLDCGNVCVRPGTGGFTLGFWSNKNGQAILKANDPAWRNLLDGLCLRTATGADYDVSLVASFSVAYTDFRTWLLNATATNMSYMLSAQLSACVLNVNYKGLSGDTVAVLTPSLAQCYGSATARISDVIAAANAALCANGNAVAESADRSFQECLKNILDALNNNQLPFLAEGCTVNYP